MNPHVSAALGAFAGLGSRSGGSTAASMSAGGAAIPRQPAPQPSAAIPSRSTLQAAGTSSFGMSGVNAHALLACPSVACSQEVPVAAALLWEKQRFWPVPPQHRLLLQLSGAAATHEYRFAASVSSSAALGYLWDHSVRGHPLVAGTALLEMASAAGACLAEAATSAKPLAVSGATFVSACLLPKARGTLLLEAVIGLGSGAVKLHSSGLVGTHLAAHISARAAVTHALAATNHTGTSAARHSLLWQVSTAGEEKQQPAAVCSACVAAPVADDVGAYHLHPTSSDATLHISALVSQQAQGHDSSAAGALLHAPRIPIAVGLYAVSRCGDSSTTAGWASVEVGTTFML